jgi:aspartyl protease family protein
MPGAIGLAVILFATALLVVYHGEAEILGLAPHDFASVASFGGLALLFASLLVSEFRGRWLQGLRALAAWTLMFALLIGAYSYRFELQEVASRVAGELAPSETVVSPGGGEVAVSRRFDGTFVVNGRVNGRDLRFIFDTGASQVVLTSESARALGFDPASLHFVIPVATANGRTMAAPITLDRVSVGSITETRVRALVTRPGVLSQNLLGMTFLERLASYEVRNNRLFLRGRGA